MLGIGFGLISRGNYARKYGNRNFRITAADVSREGFCYAEVLMYININSIMIYFFNT